jgi:hypothetical protein
MLCLWRIYQTYYLLCTNEPVSTRRRKLFDYTAYLDRSYGYANAEKAVLTWLANRRVVPLARNAFGTVYC